MRSKARILAVDDEKDILHLVAYNLRKDGYDVDEARDGSEALDMVRERNYDLVVLDLMLPGLSGLEVCRIMKKDPKTSTVPIIMLTARDGEADKVSGLETGADDYVTKPFSVREFLARVRSVLRRASAAAAPSPSTISGGPLVLDLERFKARAGAQGLELSATEFNLLRYLMERRGRVMSRDQILDGVWRNDAFVEPRTVDVHIRRLRAALESAGASQYIETVRGIGYRFREED